MKDTASDDIQELHFLVLRQELAERAHEIAQRITRRIRATLTHNQQNDPAPSDQTANPPARQASC